MCATLGPTGEVPSASSIVISRPKSVSVVSDLIWLRCGFRCYHLTEFYVFTIRSNCPRDELLTRGRFLQVVELQLEFGRSIFLRRDEDIRPRTSQCTSEVDLDFGIVAFLKVGMPSSGAV